ncbi:cell wall hydrolase [Chenggangzhangella methanolivorans]|uniref:cell wall hydrolase n=1 Tax=Chenggangzhangella methanolivorans TaxID=1437009 RepID=UPI0021BD9540|nr:cell wall hydrolase [Chenggangzhangella methanolivorans]
MYFESDKSAEDGMLAVGTVVANRLKSGRYGNSICGVVGAPSNLRRAFSAAP